MARRMTESGKFRDVWYRNLTPKDKCIWEFMISECNAAGILDIDLSSMTFHIGADITMDDLKAFNSRLVWIREDKVFIPKFIKFQYPGGLNPDNRAHKNILPMLEGYLEFDEKEGAWKPLARALQGPKEKVRVTVTEKETVTAKLSDKDSNLINNPLTPFEQFWAAYPRSEDKAKCAQKWAVKNFPLEDILRALEWQKRLRQWVKERGGFVPHPSTYLNRERWKDKPPADDAAFILDFKAPSTEKEKLAQKWLFGIASDVLKKPNEEINRIFEPERNAFEDICAKCSEDYSLAYEVMKHGWEKGCSGLRSINEKAASYIQEIKSEQNKGR